MAEIEVPFAMQAGQSVSPQNSREKLVNMYAEMEVAGRKRLLRRQRAGLRAILAAPGEKRAIERYQGNHYAVIDAQFVRFDGTSMTALGALSSSTGRCSIIFDDNGKAMISDGLLAYGWNGTSVAPIDIPDGKPAGTLAYQGGFGIVNIPGTGQFYVTAVNDFTTIDALDFATAESYPDPILRVYVDHNQLLLCGEESIEVWQLNGGTDFPFAPFVNAQIERGIVGPYAICSEDNTVYFVGDDKVVYRLNGYTPTRVSTGPIERAILNVSDSAAADCDVFTYTSGGQKFITIRFPGELTVQYNLATGLWNYVDTFGYDDWHVLSSAGHHSDYLLTDAGFAALDEALNMDEGVTMRRVAISAPGDANGKKISASRLFLDAEVGRADIGKAANVMLRVALDGETFRNIRPRSLGPIGDYKRRAVWRNLGQGTRPALEVSCTDDVRFLITAAIADVSVGSS